MATLKKREERASVAISFVIGLLGLFVLAVAIYDFTQKDEEQDFGLLFMISFVSIMVFGSLTIIKFKYARDLDSPSLYKDGICSLIGTCLSGSLLLTTAIIDRAPHAGYIDPAVSLIVGLAAIVYGFKVIFDLVMSGVPIFHPEWWVTKKESDVGESAEYQNSEKSQELHSMEKGSDNKEEIPSESEVV